MSKNQRIIPIATQEGQASLAKKAVSETDSTLSLTALPPLSLYIHVPWCVRKCPYCDFNSHEAPDEMPEADYLAALTADLEQALPLIWGRQIHTVFIGGGTPSLLSTQALDQLLAMVRARLSLWPDAEITLEANPGTAEANKFKSFAASGVNRLSVGVQSFNDSYLKSLGRIHDGRQARQAVEMALEAIDRVNLDLMYGLPGQSASEWQSDLTVATELGVDHLSLYQLTLEPQTVFAKYPPTLPDEETLEAMEEIIAQQVVAQGWDRYEVSAYAKANQRCRHNLNYWMFGDYLGIGPGAHSKLSFPDRIIRQARTRNPQHWIKACLQGSGAQIAEERKLAAAELPFEFMLNALRLQSGVPVTLFEERTGLSRLVLKNMLSQAEQRDLIEADPTRLCASELGWRHLNALQALFLDEFPVTPVNAPY
ncbi:MAG: radical SAM family heme chaperone HemW [Orrella sp.]